MVVGVQEMGREEKMMDEYYRFDVGFLDPFVVEGKVRSRQC